jgi:hypothetical protein
MSDPELQAAREHVKRVRDFAYHLMVFVLVNALLVAIDLRSQGANPVLGLDFAYWVILFWGFGIAGHGIWVFLGEHRARTLAARHRG